MTEGLRIKISSCSTRILYSFHIYRVQSFFSLLEFERHGVVLLDFVNQTGNMYEILVTGFCILNKSKSLVLIKEFYFTFFHSIKLNNFVTQIYN